MAEKKSMEQMKAEMDAAAALAMADLAGKFPSKPTAEMVAFATWWDKWMGQAGHKRLAYGMMAYAGVRDANGKRPKVEA